MNIEIETTHKGSRVLLNGKPLKGVKDVTLNEDRGRVLVTLRFFPEELSTYVEQDVEQDVEPSDSPVRCVGANLWEFTDTEGDLALLRKGPDGWEVKWSAALSSARWDASDVLDSVEDGLYPRDVIGWAKKNS